jgi:hypothetical protein
MLDLAALRIPKGTFVKIIFFWEREIFSSFGICQGL